MPAISIITPVYKVADFIPRCLDSILHQTFIDWECILIDDGSPDASGAICDEYAKEDSRFKVIHKQNGGVSSARQTGLEAACGEYIIHVDPDDYVEPTMLEELYKKAQEEDADMVICDFFYKKDDKVTYRKQEPSSLKAERVLQDIFILIWGSCWNKLVRHSCCIECGAGFPDGVNYSEDVCFNVQLLKHDIKIAYLPKAFYYYVQHEDSITNSFSPKTLHTCKKYITFLSSIIPENSKMVKRAKEIIKYNAFKRNLLSNAEIRKFYPEITTFTRANCFLRPIYRLAFAGHQHIANKLFTLYYNTTSIVKNR